MQWGLTEPNFYWELDENYLKGTIVDLIRKWKWSIGKHGKDLQAYSSNVARKPV